MKQPPAFQFYVDDFLGGTMHFTDAETGLYLRLLCVQWNAGSLPDDDYELASYGKGDTPLTRIKEKFTKCHDGRLRNDRMEEVRRQRADFVELCSKAGKHGGGNPNFAKGKPNLYYKDKGIHKGRHKGKINSPSPSPSPIPNSPASPSAGVSEHQEFIKGWTANFKEFFGFDYDFTGRDAKAVHLILRIGILRLDLLEIAKAAWKRSRGDRFAGSCKQAATVHGFHNSLNQIRVELKNENTKPNNPRLDGVYRGGTNYGEAAKRKLERQMDQTSNSPPSQVKGDGA